MNRPGLSLALPLLVLLGCANESKPNPSLAPSAPDPAAMAPPTKSVALPTGDEAASFRRDLAAIFAKPAPTFRVSATGGTVASVEGFANVALVKVGGGGTPDTACFDDEDDAIRFLTEATPGPAALEER